MTALGARVWAWWTEPVAPARIAILRVVLYLFIFVDVLLTTAWVAKHGDVPGGLYQPLFIGRLLPLPTPGPVLVPVLEVMLLASAAVAATGRLPRLAGAIVAVLYLEWMIVAMSYGKVDHDRFAFLVALAVMPTVGRARLRDHQPSESAGWAVRSIQVAVMLTYFLAAFAKLRYGGPEWVNSATMLRAVLRRGTGIGQDLVDHPEILRMAQWGIMAFELTAPLLLLRNWIGRAYLAMAAIFHIITYATVTIIFLPHVMCLLAFLPLERLARRRDRAAAGSGTGAAPPASSPAAPLPSH